jgi:hypothetical protein
MARAVTVDSATARTAALTIDRDTQLVGMSASGQWLVSTDPSATYANAITTIATDRIQEQTQLILTGPTMPALVPALPLQAGSVLYASNKSVNATLTLYFDP